MRISDWSSDVCSSDLLGWDRWDLYPRAVVPRHDEAARQPGDERVDHPSDAALKHIGERDRVPVRPQARYAYSGAALVALLLLLADHRIDLDVLHAQLAIIAEQRQVDIQDVSASIARLRGLDSEQLGYAACTEIEDM